MAMMEKHRIPCLPAGRQAPNNKQIPITKIRKPKQDCFGHWNLEIGYYLGFGFWDLEFCEKANNNRRQNH
jgi:hypothetical protein